MQSWKSVFGLTAVGEMGGEILFRLSVLSSVWILVPAVEGEGPTCCNGCVGSVVTTILVGFYFIVWLVLYCPIL
jgi:hypothetical protein